MRVLVLNAGSGSQKCSLFNLSARALPSEPVEAVWEASLDATDPERPEGKIVVKVRRGEAAAEGGVLSETSSTAERTTALIRLLWSGADAPLAGPHDLDVVGHRVVHGGERFRAATVIDSDVEREIEELSAIAPLHNPNNLIGIRIAHEQMGMQIPQIAVFDTAFHRTLPAAAATYPGPYEWVGQGIRRYGFHGISFRWASERAAQLLGRRDDPDLALIICHLGGGCSLCATRGGRSVDTTMGFTPLDGIAMSTRSGAIDPGICIHLLRQGRTVEELETLLNKQSGLKGLSGLAGDTRVIRPKAEAGDVRAALAWDVFVHRLRAGIGQMLASLGTRPHAIVFTDAISEDEPAIRAAACEPFAFLGLELDTAKNDQSPLDSDLATPQSTVRALLIKSREAWQIARECHQVLAQGSADERPARRENKA